MNPQEFTNFGTYELHKVTNKLDKNKIKINNMKKYIK